MMGAIVAASPAQNALVPRYAVALPLGASLSAMLAAQRLNPAVDMPPTKWMKIKSGMVRAYRSGRVVKG